MPRTIACGLIKCPGALCSTSLRILGLGLFRGIAPWLITAESLNSLKQANYYASVNGKTCSGPRPQGIC